MYECIIYKYTYAYPHTEPLEFLLQRRVKWIWKQVYRTLGIPVFYNENLTIIITKMNKPRRGRTSANIFLDQFVVFYQLWVSYSSCKDFRVSPELVSEQIILKTYKKKRNYQGILKYLKSFQKLCI